MDYEQLRPVVWKGALVALAGRNRFHIVAPHLLSEKPPAAELQYVALLCLYHQQVLTGALPPGGSPALAERWADAVLELQRSDIIG